MSENPMPVEVQPWQAIFDQSAGSRVANTAQSEASFASFAATGIPSTKHEEWKYTSVLEAAGKARHVSLESATEILPETLASLLPGGLALNRIVLVDGNYSASLSSWTNTDGIDFLPFNHGNKQEFKLAEAKESPFVALNTALAHGGFRLVVPNGTSVQTPIAILHISTQQADSAENVRIQIEVGKDASLQIFEAFHHAGADTLVNLVSEIKIGQGAKVAHHVVQAAKGMQYIGFTQVWQAANSNFQSLVLTTEGNLVRNNLHVCLEGQHCETHLLGLYLIDGNSHVDNHTLVDHAQPNCFSNELYKGVQSGTSTAVFNGKVMVRLDAQKTNAFQSNKTVLLSPGARINTKPQLEIFADDVKCSHGATTGRLDEEALFYLRSRGLDKAAAMSLLTFAFATDVLEKLEKGAMYDHFRGLVEQKLHSMSSLS